MYICCPALTKIPINRRSQISYIRLIFYTFAVLQLSDICSKFNHNSKKKKIYYLFSLMINLGIRDLKSRRKRFFLVQD